MGSISVTHTCADSARSACADPLPTSPYPATTATLPAIITSVARLMPSTNDSRQPYRLSNLLLVTESLTLIAGNFSRPSLAIWYRRLTPVVVSSVTPLMCPSRVEYQVGSTDSLCRIDANSAVSSSLVGWLMQDESTWALVPRCSSKVASPPSSRI